jgi:hypothetical protein
MPFPCPMTLFSGTPSLLVTTRKHQSWTCLLVRVAFSLLPHCPLRLEYRFPDMGMSMVDAGTITIDDNLFTAFNSYAISNKRDPLAWEIGITVRSRINFVMRQLKTYPTLLVKHGKTPFIHSQASYPLISPPL